MILRPVEYGTKLAFGIDSSDFACLYAWRNDPVTRANSNNSERVDWYEHVGWLHRSLRDPKRILRIAEVDGVRVGTVRADLHDGSVELSWTIAPEHRGKGYARQATRLLVESFPHGTRFTASVKLHNHASRRIAEGLGMRLTGERDGLLLFLLDPRPGTASGGVADQLGL